jgi:hypothetical protein
MLFILIIEFVVEIVFHKFFLKSILVWELKFSTVQTNFCNPIPYKFSFPNMLQVGLNRPQFIIVSFS